MTTPTEMFKWVQDRAEGVSTPQVAGIAMGVLALLFWLVSLIGIFAAALCIRAGLPLSLMGLLRAYKYESGVGLALAGLATNLVAIVLVALTLYWLW